MGSEMCIRDRRRALKTTGIRSENKGKRVKREVVPKKKQQKKEKSVKKDLKPRTGKEFTAKGSMKFVN